MPDALVLDPELVVAFVRFLDAKDPKTIATYRTTVRAFVAWLATMPGGYPFRMEQVTEAAIRGYLDTLQAAGRAPRTRAKASLLSRASAAGLKMKGYSAAIRSPKLAAQLLPPWPRLS